MALNSSVAPMALNSSVASNYVEGWSCAIPDLILRSPHSETSTLFRVKANNLAVASTVFENMIRDAVLGNGATIDDIPDVPVEEAEDVVSVIVGYVHGESNLLNHLDQSTDPVLPLNVWRAADKYAMPILQDLACKKAIALAGHLQGQQAFEIYVEAHNRHDVALATAIREAAAKAVFENLRENEPILHGLPEAARLETLRSHQANISKSLRGIEGLLYKIDGQIINTRKAVGDFGKPNSSTKGPFQPLRSAVETARRELGSIIKCIEHTAVTNLPYTWHSDSDSDNGL